jgi:polyhydroxyalkanoate synthesis repressor PhaR
MNAAHAPGSDSGPPEDASSEETAHEPLEGGEVLPSGEAASAQATGEASPGPTPGEAAREVEATRAPAGPKIIKRYSNRKLYDTSRSKYVTLDEIARMVKAGDDVRIIDNESKEDLTSVTLTQIIHEREKAAKSMPLEVLRSIIQSSGETLNTLLDRSMASATKSVESSVTEIRQGALSFRDLAARQLAELTESARRFLSREERRAEEFRRAVWVHVDQLEARLEDRAREIRSTRAALEQHHAASKDETPEPASVDQLLERNTHALEHVDALRTRLTALSVLLDRLEAAARGHARDEDEL